MKSKIQIILFLLIGLNVSNAQIDFSIFLNKKEMKKKYSGLFHNFRDYGKLKCISGNCKNGKGVFMVSNPNQFKLYIIGSFKDKAINGEALILSRGSIMYFDKKVDLIISSYIQNNKNLKELFMDNKESFFEGYYGEFKQNVLIENGEYVLNTKFREIIINKEWRYLHNDRLQNIELPHIHFINQTNGDRDISYYYKGNFTKDSEGYQTYSLNLDTEILTIKTVEFPKIVLKSDEFHGYSASYYNKKDELVSQENISKKQIKNAFTDGKVKAKIFKEQQKAKALKEEQARITRIKASSPCNAVGEWIAPSELPNYSGGSVCTKNGNLVPFSWKHPFVNKVSSVISRYSGSSLNSIYFPSYSTENTGTSEVYASNNDMARKGDKIFVTTTFNSNQYSMCTSCFTTGKLYISDENRNTLQRTWGWFLVYDYSDSRKRISSSKMIEAERRQVYYTNFKNNGNPGLQWQEEFKKGFNFMPCLNCYGMGCVLK